LPNQRHIGFVKSVVADQVILAFGESQQARPFRRGKY
jgi:hypothetical protein